jgi:choline dehydrogenase-like flavoprotein
MERISKDVEENGGTSFTTRLWDPSTINSNANIVLHNIGGCSMGKDRNNGVVDNFGKLLARQIFFRSRKRLSVRR